jgi:iron complex outermembrane receptor protein
MKIMKRIFFVIVILMSANAFAQDTGTIRGKVTSQVNGEPLAGVSVEIMQLRKIVETDSDGKYEFASLAAGRYTVVTHIEGFSDRTQTVVISSGASLVIDFSLSLLAIREEITVTASGSEESVFESFQSVNSVGSTSIRERASSSIGEVLERESGVGKRSFGPGSSRPVIRGFDGDRVLVVQDGIRNGSLASQSADHGEPIDTLNLERLEVLKGPATLLYGSNAIGGVVNAVTTDEEEPHPGVRGNFTGLGATNNKQGGTSGGIEYGFGKALVNFAGQYLREGDFKTPLGRIPNSASMSYGGHGSFGYFGEKGFVVGAFSLDRRRYGVPYAPLFEEGALLTDEDGEPCETRKKKEGDEPVCQYDIFAIQDAFSNALPEVPDEAIDLKMRRNNFRFRGGFRNVGGAIERGNFFVDYTRYRHEEIETADGIDEVTTSFFNNTFSYRGVLKQTKHGALTGQFGAEGFRRNYLTVGAESLIDGRVRQNNFAAFALQELGFERVAFQFGARVESNRYRPENTAAYESRNFTGFSSAVGARFALWEGASFIANFTSAYRSPALEELYNNGPHIGTITFEIGDQDLRRERSNGIEFSLRQRVKDLRFNGSIFYYRINDFIFLSPQDEDGDGRVDVEDNLPVSFYTQADARFAGADFSVDADASEWLGLFFVADAVDAKLRNGSPLQRIPPLRARLGVDLRHKGLSVRPEAVFVGSRKIDNVFLLETPTDGYRLFNVNAAYTIATKRTAHIFSLSVTNIGDRLYRNHLSFIKDLMPEQGRNLRASYTIRLL